MQNRLVNKVCLYRRFILATARAMVLVMTVSPAFAQAGTQTTSAPKTPPAVGTIKSITGNSLTLATDGGAELKVQLPANVKVLRVPPGSKDLKEAATIQLSDLQPGDRILVRGKPGEDAASFVASTVVAMKKSDIAEKQAKEREEWQRHGIGGLVNKVDTANNVVTIKTLTAAGTKEMAVHAGKDTVLRRYAPGSVKFDDAKLAPITEIREGDQLRARGTRTADGGDFAADEIVSGSFRNIAGTILAVNTTAATLTVSDLASKKPLEIKVTAGSQMKKLPQPMAQRIADRLKGNSVDANAGNGAPEPAGQHTGAPAAAVGQGAAVSANGNSGGPARTNGGDLQQLLSRLPANSLGDFQKGDAVMIVATSGQSDGQSTVITLLGGVEPILQNSTQGQAASILSPWSLNSGGAAEAGTP